MEGGGVVTGSGAAFLVIESREHAASRGRDGYAAVDRVVSGRVRRGREDLSAAVGAMISAVGGDAAPVVSGASGAHAATAAEKAALDRLGQSSVRGFASLTGHLKEAQFPFAVALAAIALKHGAGFAAFDTAFGGPFQARDAVAVTTVGSRRFEGAARVLAI
jgi:3-oxoacyl-[acyl-carrier-protein] synthase II